MVGKPEVVGSNHEWIDPHKSGVAAGQIELPVIRSDRNLIIIRYKVKSSSESEKLREGIRRKGIA